MQLGHLIGYENEIYCFPVFSDFNKNDRVWLAKHQILNSDIPAITTTFYLQIYVYIVEIRFFSPRGFQKRPTWASDL